MASHEDLATYGTSEVMPPPNPVEAEGEAIALLEQQQQHQQQLLHGTDHGIADQVFGSQGAADLGVSQGGWGGEGGAWGEGEGLDASASAAGAEGWAGAGEGPGAAAGLTDFSAEGSAQEQAAPEAAPSPEGVVAYAEDAMQPSNGPPTEHDPQLAGREPSSHSVRSRHSHAAANAAAPSAGLAGQHEEAAAMSPQEHDQQMPAENPAPSGALPPTTAGSATRAQARVAPVPLGEGPGDGGAGLLGSQEGTAAVRRASGGQELGASPSRHSNKSRASSIPRSPSHSDPVPRALSPSKLPPAPPHSSPFQSSSAQASDPGGPSKHSAGMRTRIRPRPMIVPPAGAHGHVKVTSPTREERLQRKMWAEVAQRRKAEVAMRLQADEAQMQKERMERMEARRAAVRARIEGEKLAQKAMAEERAAKLAGLEPAPPPIRGKRNPSPRPLYLRLQDDYEARKAAEEEETRKKLEQMAQMKRVRVASLVSGEVTIKPLPGDIKPKESNSPPRWHPSFKPIISPRSTSPGNSPGMHSARSSSIFKDLPEGGNGQPGAQHHRNSSPHYSQENGMVLYSLHTDQQQGAEHREHAEHGQDNHVAHHHMLLPPGAGGPRNAASSMLTRQHHSTSSNGNGRRFSGGVNSHGRFMGVKAVDRGSSPIQLDPTTQTPVNVPPQEQFWGRSRNPSPQRAMKQHTHLSDFSMPVKLREMGPAHAASNTKTGTSPPSKQQWQQQQQQQHLPPQVHHYQQQQQELLWGSAMQSAAAAQQQEQHSVHGASPQPQQVPPQTQAKMPVPGPSAAVSLPTALAGPNAQDHAQPPAENAGVAGPAGRGGAPANALSANESEEPWLQGEEGKDDSGSLPDAEMMKRLDAELGDGPDLDDKEEEAGERAEDKGGERVDDKGGERAEDKGGERVDDKGGERVEDKKGEGVEDKAEEGVEDKEGEGVEARGGEQVEDKEGERLEDKGGEQVDDKEGEQVAEGKEGDTHSHEGFEGLMKEEAEGDQEEKEKKQELPATTAETSPAE